ncbi:single-stranded-DNA-specific exonuclease RecJ [bacterium]|nr:single-stranded-DNA-specific exonuclease RecJ [bacterium]NCQ55003.1 single-stranded-DNA-specific exonuclease RecJ [Candidatus Parcubacteria bacterium]NCS95993.1 single-stranded-DNA-specific exonuclease RecJ [bacterium]
MKEQRSLRGKIWESPQFEVDKRFLQNSFFLGRMGEENEAKWRNPSWEDLQNPFELKDMSKAVERIKKALEQKEKIMVYGDFDADGITSTAALVHGLKTLGALVSYRIPDRINDSHGLKKQLIEEISQTGTTLLITVDCGVNDFVEVEYANQLGLEVIITDHHKVDPNRWAKNALAVLNPMRPDCDFPTTHLAGVGVVFKLLQALNNSPKFFAPYAALAAIGSVADCVKLQGETRTLVQLGLKELNKNHWPGVHALLDSDETIDAETIGFQLAPCLNAASRLGQVQHAVQLFLGDQKQTADRVAYLKQLNEQRREFSQAFSEEAKALIQPDQAVQIIFLETCPVGVLGLVASRLVENLAQPIMVLTRHPHGGLHGSARAPKNFNLAEALETVANKLNAFGGHAGAAGFSLEETQLADFIMAMQAWFKAQAPVPLSLEIAGLVKPDWLDLEWHRWEKTIEPFGMGNQKPVWQLESLTLSQLKFMGSSGQHVRLNFNDSHEVVAFFAAEVASKLKLGDSYEIAVTVAQNTWNGQTKVQWQLVDIRTA